MMRRPATLFSNTLTSTRRNEGLGVGKTSSWQTSASCPCGQSKVRRPSGGHSSDRRIWVRRFSADQVAIMEARKALLFCVRPPTARRLAPSAVPTMTSATSTSSSVKPRQRRSEADGIGMAFMSFNRELPDAIGMDINPHIARAQAQHERAVHRLAPEHDAKRIAGRSGRRADHELNGYALEFTRAQQVVAGQRLPSIIFANQEAIALG